MKHARQDYNRIQDPEGKIPEEEPVFLLRAQDVTAPDVVRYWASRAHAANAEPNIVMAALSQATKMEQWQKEHGNKIPDMP